jgi:hypothetical protein
MGALATGALDLEDVTGAFQEDDVSTGDAALISQFKPHSETQYTNYIGFKKAKSAFDRDLMWSTTEAALRPIKYEGSLDSLS